MEIRLSVIPLISGWVKSLDCKIILLLNRVFLQTWVHKKGRDSLNGAGVVPIPGTGNPNHMEQNATAVALSYDLTDEDMAEIEACVPRSAMENLPRYGGSLGERVFTKENNISLEDWKNSQ